MRAMRYDNLVREIAICRPRKIMEIGTCKGARAEMMIRAMIGIHGQGEYIGFDLFSPPPEEEFSASAHPSPMRDVIARIGGLGAAVTLIEGDTRQTLPRCGIEGVEMVFLDGGHSEETVRSDFEAVLTCIAPGAPILCDDYWNYPGGGGCKPLVDELDRERFEVELLEPVDEFRKPYGVLRTQIARVREKI